MDMYGRRPPPKDPYRPPHKRQPGHGHSKQKSKRRNDRVSLMPREKKVEFLHQYIADNQLKEYYQYDEDTLSTFFSRDSQTMNRDVVSHINKLWLEARVSLMELDPELGKDDSSLHRHSPIDSSLTQQTSWSPQAHDASYQASVGHYAAHPRTPPTGPQPTPLLSIEVNHSWTRPNRPPEHSPLNDGGTPPANEPLWKRVEQAQNVNLNKISQKAREFVLPASKEQLHTESTDWTRKPPPITILKRSPGTQHQSPPLRDLPQDFARTRKSSTSSQDSTTRPVIPPPGSATIHWISPADDTQHYIGQFFINKIYLDKNNNGYWQPSHFVDSATEITTFEDLACVTDLEQVLISDNRTFKDIVQDNFLDHFPLDMDITLISSAAYTGSATRYIAPALQLVSCEDCQGMSMQCSSCRHVMLHTINTSALEYRCRFMLLRYSNKVRFVIPAGNFSHLMWERMAQFGWYCDLPLSTSWAQQAEAAANEFGTDLSAFLVSVGIEPMRFIDKVDFSGLSKTVHLIYTMKGQHNNMGLTKVTQLNENLYWPETTRAISVCQTTGFGQNNGARYILKGVFMIKSNLEHTASNQEHLKILYPSKRVVQSWMKKHDIKLSVNDWQLLYRSKDKVFFTLPYLHDLDCSDDILPYANVYTQYQEMSDSVNPDQTRRYGWLICGSQTAGEGSWGAHKSHNERFSSRVSLTFYKHELAVAIYPYTESTETGYVIHCVDLAPISLLFRNPAPYKEEDIPFIESSRRMDMLHHLIGVVGPLKDNYVFVEQLRDHHPLNSLSGEEYPNISFPDDGLARSQLKRHERKSAFLYVDTCRLFGLDQIPSNGTILEFYGMIIDRGRIRVVKIMKCFDSDQSAMEYYKVQENQVPEGKPVYHLLGRVARYHKSIAFIEQLEQHSPLWSVSEGDLTCQFPRDECLISKSLKPSAAMLMSVTYAAGLVDQPPLKSIIEFQAHSTDNGQLRVHKLVHVHKNEMVARKHYTIMPGCHGGLSIDEVIQKMDMNFRNVQHTINKGAIPTQEDLEREYPMHPTKIKSDMEWMNGHFLAICDGKFPKTLLGAHSFHVQQAFVDALAEKLKNRVE